MSFSEWVVGLVLVALAFAVGFMRGRASGNGSSKPRPASTLRSRETSQASHLVGEAGAKPALSAVRSWGYQLQDLDVTHAAGSPFDLLVVDYAKDGTDRTALTPAELARLQSKPDGSRRLVLAYLSIGEAESYRSYWRKPWSRRRPRWLLRENPDWDQSYAVRFWHSDWQALLYGNRDAYLDKILAQGFDGVYLDKCDVADDLRRREPKAAAARGDLEGDMVDLVRRLADYARARRPGFLVVVQNAEPLLERADLRRDIDAAAKEELLFGLDAAEKPNDRDEVDWARERLDLVRKDGKPVLVVEYLDNPAKIAQAAKATGALGYVLFVADKSRELDKLRVAPVTA